MCKYKCWYKHQNQSNESTESRLPSYRMWHSLEEESYVLWPILPFKWLLTISFWNVQGRLVRPLGKPAFILPVQFSSVAQSCPTLRPHGLQHARPPCPSPAPEIYSDSFPLSQWCHPTISSSGVPFSSRLQSFPASGSFPMNRFFASGGQTIGVSASASVLPMNTQDWSLGWTGWISLRVFSNTRVQNHQFFGAQLSL